MLRLSLALLVVCAAGPAVTRAQTPATPAPTYDARFVVGDDAVEYVGTTTFALGEKGDITGALTITGPLEGTGVLSGAVKDGVWAAHIAFTLTAQNCSGVVSGSAPVPADRKIISGTATITSSCASGPQHAVFTLTKK